MARPKKIKPVEESTKSKGGDAAIKKEKLETLLKTKVHTIFDREPNPGFNGNFNKFVDEIIEIFS
jgi:hypothetical protein